VRLAELPELGRLPRRQLAALAGLAPINHDSGRLRGRRFIQGGRAAVRTALSLATLSAIRRHPTIGALYRRLIQAGKPAKLALVACLRQLLTVLNALLRDHTPWHPA
jgi:transposase